MTTTKRPPYTLRHRRQAVSHARSFLHLAMRQAEVIESAWNTAIVNRDAEMRDRLAEFVMTLHAEDYAFVMALHQATVWLTVIASFEPTIKARVRAFKASLPHLEELRDMWEHEINHFKGGGRKRERWHHPLTPEVTLMQEATAGSIWHDPSGRWTHRIGGRLDVARAAALAKAMLKYLEDRIVRVNDDYRAFL